MLRTKPLSKAFCLVLMLTLASVSARAFNFSSQAPSGQMLYFNILTDSTAELTYPNYLLGNYYSGFSKPTGTLTLPASVVYQGTTYQVVAIGSNAFHSCAGLLSVSLPGTIATISSAAFSQCTALASVSFGSDVSIIGDNAFMGCTALSSISLPNSVTMIGVGAFQGCTALQSALLSSSLSTIGNVAFEGCSSLTSLSIPNSVAIIGNWAFCNCTSLDSLYVGSSVSYLSQNVFAGIQQVHYLHYNARNANASYLSSAGYASALPVAALTHLVVGDSVQVLQQYTFAGASLLDSVYLGTHLTSISNTAFSGCAQVHSLYYNAGRFTDLTFPAAALAPFSRLSRLYVGSAVSRIPHHAFSLRDSLRTVALSPQVDTIGDSAFFYCPNLTSLSLSSSLRSVGASAFQQCSSLSGTLLLPPSMQSIGAEAFRDCSSLSGDLDFPSALSSIGQGAFQGCTHLVALHTHQSPAALPADAFYGCERLYQATLGSLTPSVGSHAFQGCIRLSQLTLGASVSAIGQGAFKNCVRLLAPSFPSALSAIADSAFYGCSLLGGQLTFPSLVSSIGNYAFSSTAPLSLIVMRPAAPPAIHSHTFASASAATPVQVPCGSLLAYRVANHWDNFNTLTEVPPFSIRVSSNDTLMGAVAILQHPTCGNYNARLQAYANAGYHFIRWADGPTANPRQVSLSSDTAFTALFVSDYSYITVLSNDTLRGTVSGSGLYGYNDSVLLIATAAPGFHFQRWNDGVTLNPRLLFASQDSTFTAIFLSNNSSISVATNQPSMGAVSGGGTYYYQSQAVLTATPFYGYHFTSWSDGDTTNPRLVYVSQDSLFQANFAFNVYTIAASSSSAAMGSVQGGGAYSFLSSATLTATPLYGYHFTQWGDGLTSNPRTLIVRSDSSFVAHFAPNSYTLSALPSDTSMGSVLGAGLYPYNSPATLTATPAVGYHFAQWSDGDTTNPRTLTVLGNLSLTAQFAANRYVVSVASADPAMGTASGGGSFLHGASVLLTATPAYGYHFTQWNDGDTANPRAFTVTHSASYVASFAPNTYTLSVSSNNPALGSVSGGGSFSFNSQTTLTATPFFGYHFVRWSDGSTANPRTVTVTADASLVALFDTLRFQLSALSANYAAGSVSGSGSYAFLSQATLTALPMPHYHFLHWSDSATSNPRLVTVVSDTSFTAHFALDTHSVTVLSADTLCGTVAGSGSWAYGTATHISALPRYGYHFAQWGDGSTANPRRVVVASDTSFTALFDRNAYSVALASNDTALGLTSGAGSYLYLDTVTLTALPVGNSRFLGWSDGVLANPRTLCVTSDTLLTALFASNNCHLLCQPNDTSMGAALGSGVYNYLSQTVIEAVPSVHHHFLSWSDGVTSNPRLVTLLHDTLFTALFAPDPQYLISASANNDSLGSVDGQGLYYYGDSAVLTPLPAFRARFVQWADGSTDNPRVVPVISPQHFTALFAPETFTLTLTANEPQLGELYGEGQYVYGQQAVITAVAFPEVQFLGWSDGVDDNPREVTIVCDTVFQALFRDLVSVPSVQSSPLLLSVQGRQLLVSGADGAGVSVYDAFGRLVAHRAQADGDASFVLPATGIYMVQVQGRKAVKVVAR